MRINNETHAVSSMRLSVTLIYCIILLDNSEQSIRNRAQARGRDLIQGTIPAFTYTCRVTYRAECLHTEKVTHWTLRLTSTKWYGQLTFQMSRPTHKRNDIPNSCPKTPLPVALPLLKQSTTNFSYLLPYYDCPECYITTIFALWHHFVVHV
jgi:hypothetical protein